MSDMDAPLTDRERVTAMAAVYPHSTCDLTWDEVDLLLTSQAEQLSRLREALTIAEAAMSIVEPRSDKAKYLDALASARAALNGDQP